MPSVDLDTPSNLTEATIMAALASTEKHKIPTEDLFTQGLLDNMRDGVIFVDSQQKIQTWNSAIELMTGISSQQVVGRPINPSIFNLTDQKNQEINDEDCPFATCFRTGTPQRDEYLIIGRSGRELKADFCTIPLRTLDETVNGLLILVQDSSAQRDLQRQLKDLYARSMLDPLTQVANRNEFERVLGEYVRAHNSTDFQCSLIICDIDFFKQINDNFGHNVGDQALIVFAQLLKKFVRSQDLVARYGGEEFVILCANCDIDAAVVRAEEIRATLTKTRQPMLNGKCITASFGVSQLKKSDRATDFFVRADEALLNAKETGRNRVISASADNEAKTHLEDVTTQSLAGVRWRKQTGSALFCEEFKTSTPLPVVVESLRGYILKMEAEIRTVEPDFASVKITVSDSALNLKGSFIVDVEVKETEESGEKPKDELRIERKATYIRITVKAAKSRWFSSNSNELGPFVLSEVRRYLMISEDSARLNVAPAATKPGRR